MTKWCANYDRKVRLLALDCECYMLGKCWTGALAATFGRRCVAFNSVGVIRLDLFVNKVGEKCERIPM